MGMVVARRVVLDHAVIPEGDRTLRPRETTGVLRSGVLLQEFSHDCLGIFGVQLFVRAGVVERIMTQETAMEVKTRLCRLGMRAKKWVTDSKRNPFLDLVDQCHFSGPLHAAARVGALA
jgi:hypothetical protein